MVGRDEDERARRVRVSSREEGGDDARTHVRGANTNKTGARVRAKGLYCILEA